MDIIHLRVLYVDRKILWVFDCIIVGLTSNDFPIGLCLICSASLQVPKSASEVTLNALEHWVEYACVQLTPVLVLLPQKVVDVERNLLEELRRLVLGPLIFHIGSISNR